MTSTTSATIRVMIADDHPMMREGIALSLAAHEGIAVVAHAADGEEAIARYDEVLPDVALIDLQMPRKDGLEAIRAIRSRHPEARLIVVSTYVGDARIAAALKAGARAYVLKTAPAAELAATVREVHEGRHVLPPALRRELAQHHPGSVPSPREMDVLRLAAGGKSNREIGALLCISEATVKAHMGATLLKLGASDRTHAVTLATQRGFMAL